MANATVPPTPRDVARQLVDQGLSNRAVAAKVGVSEATIRRWRGEWRRDDAPATRADAPDDAPDDTVTIPLDDDLRRALATLAEAGFDAPAALRMCARFVADAAAHGWDLGAFPRGVMPPMRIQWATRRPPGA